MREQIHRVACLLVLLAVSAVQAGDPKPRQKKRAWWDRATARQEAARILKAVPELLRSTERGDGTTALKTLRDSSWILRKLAAVRLEAMGMKGDAVARLKARGVPGESPPPADWKPLRAAARFVKARQVDPNKVDPVNVHQACLIVASLVSGQVHSGKETPAVKRRMISGLLAYRASLPSSKTRAWLADALLDLTDRERAVSDLGVTAKQALERGGRKVFRWYGRNLQYLYWHPRESRFRVDLAARSAGKPSAEYRKKHPWKKGEGPRSKGKPRRQ